MCGVAGLLGSKSDRQTSLAVARRMGQALHHRGPDDHGLWDERGNYLIHQRLSILDLSPAGHQPMMSQSKRFVTVFNGEIYNFKTLRAELEARGIGFRGHSDTEIMLEMVAEFGFVETLSRLKGMFAIAIWDREQEVLYLARDRMGEKPLYYGWHDGQFVFASELRALFQLEGFSPELSSEAMALFFKYNYVPSPYSIYQGVHKLQPGYLATLNWKTKELHAEKYWSYPEPSEADSEISYEESLDQFHHMMKRTVGQQMQADVPLGSFLSGGLDSSLVTSLMQAQSSRPINTFTIGFHEKTHDESGYAKEIAKHLGCQHTEWIVSPDDVKSLIPGIPSIYGEPFSDSSQLPTCLLSAMTSRKVTVALSGDGGDELFGGYYRYQWMEEIWNRIKLMPRPLRRAVGGAIAKCPEESWQALYDFGRKFVALPSVDGFGHKVIKLAGFMKASSALEAYDIVKSHWYETATIMSANFGALALPGQPQTLSPTPLVSHMMWIDSQTYLPDDLMVKVDRATMASSLESRTPFLDHEIIEFVSRLPLKYRVNARRTKPMIRDLLEKYVPTEMIDRPKKGFSVPVAEWLRRDLKSWAEDLLSPASLNHGYLNSQVIRDRWEEHKLGKRNWGLLLWDVLVFQMWHQDRSKFHVKESLPALGQNQVNS